MIRFDRIPFAFISSTLSKNQKKSIEFKYEIITKVAEAKKQGDKKVIFYELAANLNMGYQTIRNIYYTLKKK